MSPILERAWYTRTYVDVVLREALAQVVDIRVSNPLGASAFVVVKVSPHFAQVVGSHLVSEKGVLNFYFNNVT